VLNSITNVEWSVANVAQSGHQSWLLKTSTSNFTL